MKKKIISSVLASVLLASQIGAVHAARVFKTDSMIEAEDTTLSNGMIHWHNDKPSQGISVYSSGLTVSNPSTIAADDLNFLFSVNEAGTYHIYMRACMTSSNGSYYYRIDDGNWVSRKETADWEWIELETKELTEGIHKISYNHNLRGADIDAFFITKDSNNLPSFEEKEAEGDGDEETEEQARLRMVMEETPKAVHHQTYIPEVVGNGIVFEAEDMSYTADFSPTSNKQSSGGKALTVKSSTSTRPSGSSHGQAEFRYKATKSGIHNVWARMYATSSSTDNEFYAIDKNGSFTIIGPANYNEYEWVKLGAVSLQEGEMNSLRIGYREKSLLIDSIAIMASTIVPSGRTGNIKLGENEKVTIVSPYMTPPINPPAEHPRVLFTSADIPRIKENMEKPQNAAAKDKLEELCTYTDGISVGKYTERMLRLIEANAFDYAINGNEESGKIAVNAILNYLETSDVTGSVDNVTRNGGNVIYKASEVYDWCYDLLTNTQKAKIIEKCEEYASRMEMGWPPFTMGSVTSHGSEAQLLRCTLAFSIATYNERPDIWNAVGGRLYEEYIPARDYFDAAHWAFEGDSYGLYRHRWDGWSNALIKGMGYESPYNEEDLGNVAYSMLYMRRPDGQRLRDGDTSDDTVYDMWEYWWGYGQTYIMDSSFLNDDPYLKDEAFAQYPSGDPFYESSPIMFLVFNNPDVERAGVENLPKSRFFGDPAGVMIARTGWEKGAASADVVCEMKVGGVTRNGHQHMDCGHFQIYYKGILASDSGVYQGLYNDNSANGGTGYNSPHRQQYLTKTIAHNSVLVYDPSEPSGTGIARVEDGGQKVANNGSEPKNIKIIWNDLDEFRHAEVEAHEIDPENQVDPYYTYVKGNLTQAYTKKVSDFKRSFMFFNMFDEEVPGVLVVFDKITSSNPSFKKTWLLHGVEKPTVNGNQTIFSRTYQSPITPSGYNGKMTVDTMLPKAEDANITIVGGEEEGYSIVNGVDITGYSSASHVDEGDTYRMELSPKNSNDTDYFLNVIQVSDNDKNYYLSPSLIETDKFYGASVKDRAVVFSKSGKRVETDFTIDFPESVKATVCDVKAGKWQVSVNGEEKELIATKDGGVLAFDASGKVSFKYIGEAEEVKPEPPVLGTETYTSLEIAGQYVKCPVRPENIGGRVMIPLSTFVAWFKLNKENSGDRIVVTNGEKSLEFSLGSTAFVAGENTFDMVVAPYEKDGEIMVPARDFAEFFDGEISWEPGYSVVSISLPKEDYSIPAEGYAVMAKVTPDNGAVDGNNVAENAIDGDGDSIWAALGKGRYIDIEFDKVTTIDRVDILFNPNGGRTARFDILVSNDGTNYTKVLTSVSDGSLEGVTWEYYDLEQPIKTKYVRYMANGSNISDWNAIKEIRFRKK